MTNESKLAFFTSDDSVIAEARTLYKLIVKKYQSETITDFATDGSGNKFDVVDLFIQAKNQNFVFYLATSMIFVTAISLTLILLLKKKKNKIE